MDNRTKNFSKLTILIDEPSITHLFFDIMKSGPIYVRKLLHASFPIIVACLDWCKESLTPAAYSFMKLRAFQPISHFWVSLEATKGGEPFDSFWELLMTKLHCKQISNSLYQTHERLKSCNRPQSKPNLDVWKLRHCTFSNWHWP